MYAIAGESRVRLRLTSWARIDTSRWLAIRLMASHLVRHELWLMCPVVLCLIFPNRYSTWALVPIPMMWLARWVATGRLTVRTPLDLPIGLLVLWVPMGLYASPDLEVSLAAAYKLIGGVALYYSIANWLKAPGRGDGEGDAQPAGEPSWHGRAFAIVALLSLGGVGLAFAGLAANSWQSQKLFLWPELYARLPRLLSETINGNVLGGALAQLIPLPLGLLLFGGGQRWGSPAWRLFSALCLGIMWGALVLCQSRGAILAAGVAICVVLLARTRWALALLPAIAVGGYQVAATSPGQEFLERLHQYISSDALGSWQGRLEVWRHAVDMVKDVPLTGAGLNTFSVLSPLRYPYWQLAGREEVITHAHNVFLQVAVDLGLPGLALLLWLLGAIWLVGVGEFRGSKPAPRALLVGPLAGLLVFGLHGLVDSSSWNAKPGIILWALAGVVMGVRRTRRPRLRSRAQLMALVGSCSLAIVAVSVIPVLTSTLSQDLGNLYLNRALASEARVPASVDRLTDPAVQEADFRQDELAVAMSYLGRALQVWPGNQRAHRALGLAYAAKGLKKSALDEWRGMTGDLPWLLAQGDRLYRLGQYNAALEIYRLGLAYSAGMSSVHYRLGRVYQEQGELEKATAEYQAAKEYDSFVADDVVDVAACYFGMGEAYGSLKRWGAAVWQYETGLRLREEADIYGGLALIALYQLGDSVRAREYAGKAVAMNPSDPWARVVLAEVLIKQQRYQEAENALRTAVAYFRQAGDDVAEPHSWLSRVYLAQGKHDLAVQEARVAVALEPKDAGACLLLGDALLAEDRIAEAAKAYSAALAIDPNNRLAARRLEELKLP